MPDPTTAMAADREGPPATPAFVVDEAKLTALLTDFQRSLSEYWPNSILGYSFKTNSLPWLIAFMRDHGAWAEVVSDTEFDLALALGYPYGRVIFNGPVKGRDHLHVALSEGSVINLDSKREVRWTCEFAREHPRIPVGVGLRVNWDVETACPGESTAHGGRFGFNVDNGEFDDALGQLRAAGVRISGLHLHTSSATQSECVYRAAATVAAHLVTSRRLDLDYLDVGGGFFGGEHPDKPTFDDYLRTILDAVTGVIDPNRTRLIVEPGGSLTMVPIEFHTSVIDTKRVGEHTIVVTDGSRTNIDPMHRRAAYDYRLVARSRSSLPSQVVVGFTCMEHDRLMELSDAAALAEGDRIIYDKVGAYTMAFQPLFIEFHPAVYVRTVDGLVQVRERWGANECLQRSSWPRMDPVPVRDEAGD